MKPQNASAAAMIAVGGLILAVSAPRSIAATRYVWLDSPSPGPPTTEPELFDGSCLCLDVKRERISI